MATTAREQRVDLRQQERHEGQRRPSGCRSRTRTVDRLQSFGRDLDIELHHVTFGELAVLVFRIYVGKMHEELVFTRLVSYEAISLWPLS